MKCRALLLTVVLLPGCVLFQRPFRPEHAPKEEAAKLPYPLWLPSEGRVQVPANLAAAIGLAMDDMLPRDVKPPRDATPDDVCLHRRDSYDVEAAPLNEEVVLVRFLVKEGACRSEGATATEAATYAIDVRGWRILAVQR
ncbi:hypothetical protein [Corallococcus macrosporus]|uniref:Uncharacterized protein n=1 Tax=Corallococcus macrosporus DSM 14697 TaxID=1189310 RepID=A0A250JKP6_9BACT|nr:hypothetical protein [Corallococcus macrosporus]ATB44459.1 hypothetical protein MYMAC_000030 [Corallococcus macrosporus DSM 14697]